MGRQRARRAHGARDAALGLGGARRPRRGAALRSPVLRREPGHRRGQELPRRAQPRLARARRRRAQLEPYLATAAKPGDARPVRARSATSASTPTARRASRLEPHGHAQGQLGEDRGQGGSKAGRRSQAAPARQGRAEAAQAAEAGSGRRPPAEIAIDDLGKRRSARRHRARGGAGREAQTSCSGCWSISARGGCARSSPGCAPTIPIRRCWSASGRSWSPT